VLDHALLDVATALTQTTRDIGDNLLPHGIVEDIAEEGAGLLVVRVRVLVGVAASLAIHHLWSLSVNRVLYGRASDRVGLIVRLRAVAAIDSH
jgi:hypothetical protein